MASVVDSHTAGSNSPHLYVGDRNNSPGREIYSAESADDRPRRPLTGNEALLSKPTSADGSGNNNNNRVGGGEDNGVRITVYASSRDGATRHSQAAGRVGGQQQQQQQQGDGSNANTNTTTKNVYTALDELRFEILEANSQAIYLTQCQDYTEAEQLLVNTFNRLVELEHTQQQQLSALEAERERLTADEEHYETQRQEVVSRLRSTSTVDYANFEEEDGNDDGEGNDGADPDVEALSSASISKKAQQQRRREEQQAQNAADLAALREIEEELTSRREYIAQLRSQHAYATQLNDLLKATTLNNLAFVIYHRGMFVEALTHLETAQQLEAKYGIQSPAVAINLCVVHNATNSFDLASQYALLAIDVLRKSKSSASAASNSSNHEHVNSSSSGNNDAWKGVDPQEATGLAPTTFEEKKKLWGAAWHNLAIAQLQLADPKSVAQNSNVRLMFENSIAATTELLGKSHPMTRGIVESYRIVRKTLRERGAYKPQRQLASSAEPGVPIMHTYFSEEALQEGGDDNTNNNKRRAARYSAYTGKRIPPPTTRGAAKKEAQQLSVTLRTSDGVTYVEKIDTEPYSAADEYASRTAHQQQQLLLLQQQRQAKANNNNNGALVVVTNHATGRQVAIPQSPRLARLQRDAAVAKEQALVSRNLSRGCPSTPRSGAGGGDGALTPRGTSAVAAPYGSLPLPPIGTPRTIMNNGGSIVAVKKNHYQQQDPPLSHQQQQQQQRASTARAFASSNDVQQQPRTILNRQYAPSAVNNTNPFFVSSGKNTDLNRQQQQQQNLRPYSAENNANNNALIPAANSGAHQAYDAHLAHSQNGRKNQIAASTKLLGGTMLQGNLALAVALYSNPHPLSASLNSPRKMAKVQQEAYNMTFTSSTYNNTTMTTGNNGGGGKQQGQLPTVHRLPALPSSSLHSSAQQQQQNAGGYVPAPPPASASRGGGGGGFVPRPPSSSSSSPAATTQQQQQQQTSAASQPLLYAPRPPSSSSSPPNASNNNQNSNNSNSNKQLPSSSSSPPTAVVGGGMLIGDMWVEAPIAPPRAPFRTEAVVSAGGRSASVALASANNNNRNGSIAFNNTTTASLSPTNPRGSSVSYAYPQQTVSIPREERVVNPVQFAHMDATNNTTANATANNASNNTVVATSSPAEKASVAEEDASARPNTGAGRALVAADVANTVIDAAVADENANNNADDEDDGNDGEAANALLDAQEEGINNARHGGDEQEL